jgi:hypothetical protein
MKHYLLILILVALACSGSIYNDSELRERISALEQYMAVHDLEYRLDELALRELRCNQQRLQWDHPDIEWGWCEPGEGIQ